MAHKISKRSDISVFRVLDFLRIANERERAGDDIIHMEAGQPSDGAPWPVIAHAKHLLDTDPKMGYTEATGMPALKERIVQWYHDHYSIDITTDQVTINIGASGGFLFSFLTVFEEGDKVALAAPGYPAYRNILIALGLKPVEIQTTDETNYQPTAELLEQLDEDIDGLIIASPSNPAGTVLTPNELKAVVEWCEKKGVRLISDELYHGVVFDGEVESVLKYTNNAIVVNSFSKYFAMTGWRLGWTVTPPEVTARMKCLAESMFVAPPTLAQHMALKVFDHTEILDTYVQRYKKNLEILKTELPKAGITKISDVKGSFYLYADIGHITDNTEEYCMRMLDDIKVAVTPGIDFDTVHGNKTIRISFAGSTDDVIEACKRIQNWGHNQRKANAG